MPYNRKTFSDEPVTETFYFPLTIQMEDEDCEDLFEVSSSSVRWFEDEIQEAIDDYQSDINMTQYLCDDNDEIQHKLISAKWGVETMNGDIYGRPSLDKTLTAWARDLNSTRLRWMVKITTSPSGTAEMTISSTLPMKWTSISASRPVRASAVCKKAVCILHWG